MQQSVVDMCNFAGFLGEKKIKIILYGCMQIAEGLALCSSNCYMCLFVVHFK